MLIRRIKLIEMLGLTRDRFDGRVRRGLFPFPADIDGRRAYTLHDALLGQIVDRFHEEHGTQLEVACSIAIRAFPQMQARWDDLARSRNFPVGAPERFVVSRTKRPAVVPPVLAIDTHVGTAKEYAKRIGAGRMISTVAIDLTAVCTEFDERTDKAGLDTSEFWLAGGA